METYAFNESLPSLDLLLDKALDQGIVRLKRKDGNCFIIKPEKFLNSPLDIEGIDSDISTDEIIDILHEIRER